MAVYVDSVDISWRGKRWCHMVADTIDELHRFADRLGLKRSWFQTKSRYAHYDITYSVREKALALGAQVGDKETVIQCAKRMKVEHLRTNLPISVNSGAVVSLLPQ